MAAPPTDLVHADVGRSCRPGLAMRYLGRTDSVAAEHPQLTEAVDRVIDLLGQLGAELGSTDGQSVWSHHLEFAERARWLAGHLRAATVLADGNIASSFVVLRTAMEHATLDELLLLADRYEQHVKTEHRAFEELRAEYEGGTADWTKNVVIFERTKKGARLVRVGHPVTDDDGNVVEQISPYYPAFEHHDAILGPERYQDQLAAPFADPDRLREWARTNSGLYRDYLRWSSLLGNLRLNERAHESELMQLEVHYRFLSAYVHATPTGYGYIEPGRAGLFVRSEHWHAITELALLYACSIGISELRSFVEFADRRPQLTLGNRASVIETCDSISDLTSYLWYPRIGRPCDYDYVQEANRRAHRTREPGQWGHPSEHPRSIPPDEVGYYPNPLKRLAALHTGGNEITTSLGFRPLW